MTQVIIDDVLPRTQLIASAGQTVFNTNWTADATTDIEVYARADGVEPDDQTQLVSSADYTVTFVGSTQTVRVTFSSGRTLDDVITIVRNTPADRTNLYINTNFTPSMLNEDFGILTLVDQQAQMYDTVINPGYNVSAEIEPIVDTVLPTLPAGYGWRKNSAGTEIEAVTIPDGGFSPSDATYLLQTPNAFLTNSQAMSALASGFVVNTTSTGVQLSRELNGASNQIDVSNTDGISGNPVFSLSSTLDAPGTFTIQGTVALDSIIDDDTFATATDSNIPTSESVKAYVDGLDSGNVKSVTGTANEIDVDNTDAQNPVISLPTDLIAPGIVTVGNLKLDTNTISSLDTHGNINLVPDGAGNVTTTNNIQISDTKGIVDENSNEQLVFNTTGVAVNHLDITNAATGSSPTLSVDGDDANIDFNIRAKGTGDILFNGSNVICGNPGTEASGIDINGVTYNSTFKVSNISATDIAQTILHRHSTTLQPLILAARSNSDTDAHTAVTNGMSLFSLYASGWTASHYDLFGAINIGADATGTISATSSPGSMSFQVTADGSNTPTTWLSATNDKAATFAGNVTIGSGSNTLRLNSSTAINAVIDDDTMATASATNVPTAESVVAYVSTAVGGAGGSDTQIQYNNSGTLAGDTGFTTNGAGGLVSTGYFKLQSDTGTMYFGAGDDATIVYNGTNLVINPQAVGSGNTVFSSGNVGIGEVSPGSALHVYRASNPSLRMSDTTPAASGANSFIFGLCTSNNAFVTGSVAGDSAIAAKSAGKLIFGTSSSIGATQTLRMAIDPSGNVGIGTSSPSSELDVSSPDTTTIEINAGDANLSRLFFGDTTNFAIGYINYDHTSDSMRIGVNNSERMRIDSSGNVGIGTTSPGAKLDVNGTGNFTGNLTLAAQLYQSTAAGITASTTQTQGQQPLTKLVNQISTVANANDVVTLPTAVAGLSVLVVNYGANTLQIFPASGDNLGAGVDTSTTLGTGESKRFTAFDATNWELENSTTTSSSTLPIGTMIDFAGTSAPTDYLLCDGSAIDRTTYAALFGIIGTTWGVGDGSTTFNIPDFSRRVAVGSGGTGTATLGNAVGNVGGAEDVTLTTAQLPAHTHALNNGAFTSRYINGGSDVGVSNDAGVVNNINTTSASGSAGSGDAHNNIQPSAVVYKCIKYQ